MDAAISVLLKNDLGTVLYRTYRCSKPFDKNFAKFCSFDDYKELDKIDDEAQRLLQENYKVLHVNRLTSRFTTSSGLII